jgi:Concanavalin A-like lectin/glucanases superfamily
MKSFLYIFLLIILIMPSTKCQISDNGILLWWKFDDKKEIQNTTAIRLNEENNFTKEEINGDLYKIVGLSKYVPGVKGTALKFDGFSSYIEGVPRGLLEKNKNGDNNIEMPRQMSVEAWISLGAYPWNWAPILTIGKYMITGFYLGIDSRGRVGFQISDGTSVWHECNSILDPSTLLGLQLKKWYHIVGTYSPQKGLSLYINGKLANTYTDFTFDYGITYSDLDKGFRMGMNRDMLAPTDPVRAWATFPSRYSLDGIIDEVKVYKRCLTQDEVQELYRSVKVENEPEFALRNFPAVKTSGRFAANYARLKYYPEWDNLWPAGDQMDIVVQFDQLPVKIMFWRGTRYSPCWVSENGKWMADQSRETGNNWFLSQGSSEEMPTGCIEHMSDIQCRSSRVAIIEDNAARKVINWRYLQMDVKFRQKDLPNNTGFGEWGNELYYVYPDGVAVRKLFPGRGGWQETILLDEPGTRPEDNIELNAVTLLNMDGDSKTYSWEKGYPHFDLPDGNIQVVNLKSKYKPFLILRKGGSFEVFGGEVRPEYSHFPWWNHWPVAQIHSDGRYACAPDRAAHTSLSNAETDEDVAIYGMTDENLSSLVTLARSWNYPAELTTSYKDVKSEGFDYNQRAYIIKATEVIKKLEFNLNANSGSPVYDPAFVIKNWRPYSLKLQIDGKEIHESKDFRFGTEYDVEGNPVTIVWIRLQSEKPTKFELVEE